MADAFIVTGTDTGIGKTIFAAGLTQALGAHYWKPVQAGLAEETDSEVVARLSGQPVLPEAYRLEMPASPHISAAAEGRKIDAATMEIPQHKGPLVIEGAGGVMVPLSDNSLFLDVFARWQVPVILCARTQLGTINHTLLSLQALRHAGCPVLGVAFIGDAEPEVERSICHMGQTRHLGRLPLINTLTPETLRRAFAAGFDLEALQ